MNHLLILILMLCSIAQALGPCRVFKDPDEFFDQLGASCVDYDDSTYSPGTRDDWSNGQLTFSIGTGDDIIRTILVQGDGKLIAAGRSYTGTTNQILIVRFALDGNFDLAFNGTGQVVTTLGTQDAIAHKVVLETNGNLFFAGRAQNATDLDFLGARYLTNGTLDTSFATKGFALISIGTAADLGRGLALDSSSRYYIAGYSWAGTYYVGTVIRLSTNGLLDTSFKTTGKSSLNLFSNFFGILSTKMDTLGRVVFGGTAFTPNWQIVAGRLLSDGNLDTSFATLGYTVLSIGTGNDQLYTVDTFADKIILVGAYFNGTNMDAATIRLMSNGALDTSWNGTGKLGQSFSTGDDFLYDSRLDTAAGIIAVGYGSRTDQDFLAVRYNSNGTLDTSFVTIGYQFSTLSNTNEQAYSVYVSSSGQIYPVGRIVQSASNSDVAIIRYSDSGAPATSGALDDSFGSSGVNTISTNMNYKAIRGIGVNTTGRITLLCDSNTGVTYIRIFPDGSIDTSFGTVGYRTNSPGGSSTPTTLERGMLLDTYYAFGCNGGAADPHVSRISSNGTLDTSFFTLGYRKITSNANCNHGIVDTFNRPYSVDYFNNLGDNFVTRLQTNGAFDTSWATNGKAKLKLSGYSQGFGAAMDTFGRLILGVGHNDPGFLRANTNGTLDTSFATIGYLEIATAFSQGYTWGAAVGPNGKIWGAHGFGAGAGTDIARVYRFDSNGTFDTSFATIGWADVSANGDMNGQQLTFIQVQSNDKVIVDLNRDGYVAFARLSSNGTLDTSFATLGRLMVSLPEGWQSHKFKISLDGRICAGNAGGSANFMTTCFWP